MKQEQWRRVTGFEGRYEVSDLGRVRSLVTQRVLDGNTSGHVYRRVTFWLRGQHHYRYVHQLVAEEFIGPRPDGMEVCHNNGDDLDNRAENLRYDTSSENKRDQVRHGRHYWANKTHCPQGHAYTPENTAVWSGRRNCRTCKRKHNQAYKRRLREQRQAA